MSAVPAHERLQQLFERVLALPPEQRAAALADCDAATRERVLRLVAADEDGVDPLAAAVAGEAATLVAAPLHGMRFGAWRVLRELGAGGMGAVLLAERADGQFRQQVAIKLIRGFPTEDGMRRLRQERQILAQLDHPNIAHLLDGGESDDGQPFVVMEYVDGVPLLDYVAARDPDLRARLALFDKVASAVQHAHERLVIHRDLKPGNVLVRDDGEPRLLDFGVAKLVDLSAASDPRQTSTRVWTPGYASPEQQSGGLVTTASDVYALAILLREMLTGERADGARGMLPPGFRALPLDADLRGILQHASALDPAQRYPTVEAFRADLQRWREGRPVRAAPDTPFYRARKFVRRHRVGVALAALALFATAAGVWRLESERSRALAAEASAEREAANARAAMNFLAGALGSVAPEQGLSAQVSVRDLLERSRERLDADDALAPEARRTMQRLLGHLYMSLGEPLIALRLFDEGMRDEEPASRAAALQLAADEDGRSSTLGVLERGQESLESARRAQALRERFAPGDALQALYSQVQIAFATYRTGDIDGAVALWEAAIAQLPQVPDPPLELVGNLYQGLANVLVQRGEYQRPLQLVEEATQRLRGGLAEQSPDWVLLLRARAQALELAGRYGEAEVAMREAIARQEQAVGTAGYRMAMLVNGLGMILSQVGRYTEAAELMTRSMQMGREAQAGDIDYASSLSNIASVYENAGDYPRAIALFDEAIAVASQAGDPGAPRVLRLTQRNRARTLALAGQTGPAREILESMKQQLESQGDAEPVELAMLVWQLTHVARRDHDPDRGEPLLHDSRQRFGELLPEQHPVFAHAHRVAASFARDRGALERAESEQRRGLAMLEALEAVPVDVAIARAELASILLARGDAAAARSELAQALPLLREHLLPTEITRAAAEALDARLGQGRGPD